MIIAKEKKIILFLLYISVYASALFTGFIGDDSIRILNLKRYLEQGWGEYFSVSMPDRPFLVFTIYINYLISGVNPLLYKIVNITLHLCNGLLLFKLFDILKERREIKISEYQKIIVVTIFLILPINAQAVISIIQRGVLLSTFFGLLYIISLDKFYKSKKRKFALFSSLVILLGILSKPNAFIFIFLAYYIFNKENKKNKIINLINLIYLIFPLFMLTGLEENLYAIKKFSSIEYFFYQINHFYRYIFYSIYPFNLRFIHDYEVKNIFTEISTFLSILGHMIILIFLKKKNKKEVTVLTIMLYLSMVPESSFFSIMHTFHDHRFYVPSIFFVILIVQAVKNFKFNKIVYSFFILYLSICLNLYFFNCKTPYDFDKNTLKFNRSNFSIYLSNLNLCPTRLECNSVLNSWEKEYPDLKGILIPIVLEEKLNNEHFEKTLIFIQKELINEKYLKYQILIHMLIFKGVYEKYLNVNKSLEALIKTERSLFPIILLLIKNPISYDEILRAHYKLLVELKKSNKIEDQETLMRIYSVLNCMSPNSITVEELDRSLNENHLNKYLKIINYCN